VTFLFLSLFFLSVFHKSIVDATAIDGYSELLKADQELLHRRLIKSATEEDEDAKPLDPDSLVRKTWTEKKEPSADLLMPLLPYQKEGLGWMSSQEHGDVHGGILADEMGMGESEISLSVQELT
jgi:SNF2 family DNA or RNA helicase